MEMAEVCSEAGDGKSRALSSAETSQWPISVDHSRASECCLCSCKSTDPNPIVSELSEASEVVAWRPWAKYRKIPQHCVRVAEGKCCLPCFNVFRLLGKDRKYGSYQAYYKHVSQKTNQQAQNEHKDFLAGVKNWLKQHEEDPEKFKLKSKEDLLKTQKQLIISKKQGGKLTAPKKQFVLSSHWNPEKHGEWDPAKEVDHFVDGALRKGVWRQVGEEGVYDFEAYEDTGLEERVIEHDGEQEMFAEEAFQAKKQAALETMQKQAKDRDAVAVKGKEAEVSFADLVQVVTKSMASAPSSSAVVHEQNQVEGNPDTEGPEEVSSASSSSSSEDEEDIASGLDLLRSSGQNQAQRETPAENSGRASKNKKAKAKAKAKEASRVVVKAPATSKGRNSLGEKASGQAAVVDAGGMLSLDGRANRTLKTLEAAIRESEEKMNEVSFNDPPQSATQLKSFRAEANERIAKLSAIAKKAKDTVTRVSKSNNKDSFEKQLDELQTLGNVSSALVKLLTNATASSLDADAYICAYTEAADQGAKLGPLYLLKLIVAQGQKQLLYGKYDEFCQAFMLASEPMPELVKSLGHEGAAKHCTLEVENRMLASLRGIPASELSCLVPGRARDSNGETPRANECYDLADAIVKACAKESFMVQELEEAVTTVRCLLGQDHLPTLCQQVEAFQSLEGKNIDSVPALQKFFFQHENGKALMALAQTRVQEGEAEKAFQEKLDDLEKAVTHLMAWPKQSPPAAESGVLAVEKRVEPAVDALAAVKKTAFYTNSTKKKKHGHGSSSSLNELDRMEKLLSAGCCDLVRLVCKENMENHVRLACNGKETKRWGRMTAVASL